MEQKYNCELIQDLLPLYRDGICSTFSRTVVEEHLPECKDCSQILEQLKNDDLETELIEEKNHILKAYFKRERKRTFFIGIGAAGILMIPVIVCLICNLAIGHGLDWFFIVLTALLVTASIIVVPLIVPDHTALWTLGSFTVSLLLLLLSTCLYTDGDWFFLASIPTLLGLSVVFMPYVIRKLPLPALLAGHNALLVMIWDTLLLYAVITVCGFHTTSPDYWRPALQITTYCVLLPWATLLIIRYTKLQILIKIGLCAVLAGIFTTCTNYVISVILWDTERLLHFSPERIFVGNEVYNIVIGILAILTGLVLTAAGFIRQHKKA